VRSGIDHTIAKIIVRQVIAFFPAVERKLQHLHARKATFSKQRADIRCQIAQIFGDNPHLRQSAANCAHKIAAGTDTPMPVHRCLFLRIHRVISGKSAEMVDPNHIKHGTCITQTTDPPLIAGTFVFLPAVKRIAPKLPIRRKRIRRASGHFGQIAGLVNLKQLRLCPKIAGIRRNIDWDVADNGNSPLICIAFQRGPLLIEPILKHLPVPDLIRAANPCLLDCLRITVAQRLWPFYESLLAIFLLERHEKRIIRQPERIGRQKIGISVLRGLEPVHCFF